MADAPRTPTYHSLHSPRVGGCVSAFFQFFDWNPSKRFSSTKRLPAGDRAGRRSRSFRSDHSAAAKTILISDDRQGDMQNRLDEIPMVGDLPVTTTDDANMRAPGLVARLMGLDSLPDGPYQPRHHRSQSFSGSEALPYLDKDDNSEMPVLLQDLLNRDFKTSKKSMKDKFPSFAKRSHEQHERRETRRGSSLSSMRCGPDGSMSPYVDSPVARRHTLQDVPYDQKDEKKKNLLHNSPVLLPSKAHNQMTSPLRSPASCKGVSRLRETSVRVLEPSLQPNMRPRISQGWPLAGPRPHCDLDCGDEASIEVEQFPQRGGRRGCNTTEFAAPRFAAPKIHTSNASKLLQSLPMNNSWNGKDENELRTERVDGSVLNRGSVSFREPCRKDRGSRDRCDKAMSERPQSLSPPRHRHCKIAGIVNTKEEKAMVFLETHEASVREFKTFVRNPSPSVLDTSSWSVTSSSSADIESYSNQAKHDSSEIGTHSSERKFRTVRDAVEDSVTSQGSYAELPISTDPLQAMAKSLKTRTTERPERSFPKPTSSKNDTHRVPKTPSGLSTSQTKAKEGITSGEKQQLGRRVQMSQSHDQSTMPSLPATGRPPPPSGRTRATTGPRNPKEQHEKAVTLSGSRVFPAECAPKGITSQGGVQGGNLPKTAGGSILNYGKLFSGRKDGEKLMVVKKIDSAEKRGTQGGKPTEISLRSTLRRQSSLSRCAEKAGAGALKQSRKNYLQGVQKARENLSLPSDAIVPEKKTSPQGSIMKLKGESLTPDPTNQSKSEKLREIVDDTQAITSSDRERFEVRFVSTHTRARSVDDVFPELPLDMDFVQNREKIATVSDGFDMDGQNPGSVQRRSIERMFGKGIVTLISSSFDGKSPDISFSERINGAGVSGALSSSPLVDCEVGISSCPLLDCDQLQNAALDPLAGADSDSPANQQALHAKLQELFTAGVDDLHWEDEMVERRRNVQLKGRYSDRRESGQSTLSACGLSDEDGSPRDTCSASARNEPVEGTIPRAYELMDIHVEFGLDEESLTPVPTEKFLEECERADLDVDETGQPSPVSILESPFQDEACTTSESSLAESERQLYNEYEEGISNKASHICNGDVELILSHHEHDGPSPASSTPEMSDSDKIRQAILDISMFQSFEVSTSCEIKGHVSSGPQEEQSFVREVLSAAQFLSSPGSSPNWFDRNLAIDPSLFDRLESGDIDQSLSNSNEYLHTSGGLWRSDRKLLFDCVNEVFALMLWQYKDPEQWLRRRPLGPRPAGQVLVEEVYEKIKEWRELGSEAIDTLIERDMSIHVGKWNNFSIELTEVGLDIECMLWKVIVEEVVNDLAETSNLGTRSERQTMPINIMCS